MILALRKLVARRPIGVWMFWAALALLGVVSLTRMPVALLPDQNYPGVTIRTEYSGIGPEDIEKLITRPLEDSLSVIGGVIRLFSYSEDGRSTIEVQFEAGEDMDLRSLEIRERIDAAAAEFPADAHKPSVEAYDAEKSPVFIVTLDSAALDLPALREIAERDIKKSFQALDDASEVIVAGGLEQEVVVACDKEKLERYGVSLAEIVQTIRDENLNQLLGRVREGSGDYAIIARGRFPSLASLRSLPIRTRDGHFRLEQVADVNFAYREPDSAARLDGKDRVSIYVHKASGGDLLGLSEGLRRELQRVQGADWTYDVVYDQGAVVSAAFRNWALFLVAALAAYCLWHVRRGASVRTALLIAGAIPLAALCAAFPLFLAGVGLNLVTAAGVLLAMGLLAAGAAMDVHARKLSGAAGSALAGMFALMVALPLIAGDPQVRSIYLELVISLVFAMLCGLGLLLSLPPPMLRRLAPIPEAIARPAPLVEYYRKSGARVMVRLALRRARNFAKHHYKPWMAATLLFIIGLALLVQIDKSVSGALEEERLDISVELPSGASFESANEASRKVEEKLAMDARIKRVISRVDASRGSLRVELHDGTEADDDLIRDLKRAIGSAAPASIFINRPDEVKTLRGVTVEILGEDLKELRRIVQETSKQMEQTEGVTEVIYHFKPPRTERLLVLDRQKVVDAGLSAESVGSNIRFAVQGGISTRYVDARREYDIRIRYSDQFRRSLEALGGFTAKSASDDFVAALELSEMRDSETPVRIFRTDRKRSLSFSLRLDELSPVESIERIDEVRNAIQLPDNYRIQFGHEARRALSAERRLLGLLLAGAALVCMLLAALYESLRIALVQTVFLPVLAAPGLALLALTGTSLSAAALLGLLVAVAATLALVTLNHKLQIAPADVRLNCRMGGFAGAAFFVPLAAAFGEGGALLRSAALGPAAVFLGFVLTGPLIHRATPEFEARLAGLAARASESARTALRKLARAMEPDASLGRWLRELYRRALSWRGFGFD